MKISSIFHHKVIKLFSAPKMPETDPTLIQNGTQVETKNSEGFTALEKTSQVYNRKKCSSDEMVLDWSCMALRALIEYLTDATSANSTP